MASRLSAQRVLRPLLATRSALQLGRMRLTCGGVMGEFQTPSTHALPALVKVTMLTSDHRWTSEEERARLAGMGIQLEGRTRLYGLNLSRCLGDKFLKVTAACRAWRQMSGAGRLAA